MPARNLRGVVRHLRGLDHGLGYMAIDLNAHGRLLLERAHLLDGFVRVADKAVGRHELGVHGGRPLLAAEDAEAGVRDVFHRREQHRPLSQIYVPYLHLL